MEGNSNALHLLFGGILIFLVLFCAWKILEYTMVKGKEEMYSDYRNNIDRGVKNFERRYYAWLAFWVCLLAAALITMFLTM